MRRQVVKFVRWPARFGRHHIWQQQTLLERDMTRHASIFMERHASIFIVQRAAKSCKEVWEALWTIFHRASRRWPGQWTQAAASLEQTGGPEIQLPLFLGNGNVCPRPCEFRTLRVSLAFGFPRYLCTFDFIGCLSTAEETHQFHPIPIFAVRIYESGALELLPTWDVKDRISKDRVRSVDTTCVTSTVFLDVCRVM